VVCAVFAQVYRNETEVGEGAFASGVPRDQLFITSKLQVKDHGDTAYEACLASLARLGTAYL
jgi:2,5-diketo-D-gluconate reductase A